MINPYTDADKAEIQKARRILADANEFFLNLTACGRDCTDKEQERAQADAIFAAYLQRFMPDTGTP